MSANGTRWGSRGWNDAPVDVGPRPGVADGACAAPRASLNPAVLEAARAVACAVREARPSVELPPHLFAPWRAEPLALSDTKILLTTDATVNGYGSLAADAEGIDTATLETGGYGTILSYEVPQGFLFVVRRWGWATDALGYTLVSGTQLVQARLKIGGNYTRDPLNSRGLVGTPERPFDVSYVVQPGRVVAVEALQNDTGMWHPVEAVIEGYLVESADITDTVRALLGERCA